MAEVFLNESSIVVSEEEGSVDVCIVLEGELDRDISVDLDVMMDTADSRDFESSRLVYTFVSGSLAGSTVCNAVGISRDGVVEDRERFVVEIQPIPEDSAVDITRNKAEIFIKDSPLDCKNTRL